MPAMTSKGLQSLTQTISNVPLSTLASLTALTLSSTLDGLTTTFLLKRVRYMLQLEGVTADEGPLVIGLANGDASAGEIGSAMVVTNTVGPSDVTQQLTQDQAWIVLQDSLESLRMHDGVGVRGDTSFQWHSVGKNGIPMKEGSGIKLFIFNADASALTTGVLVKGLVQYQGVWLND